MYNNGPYKRELISILIFVLGTILILTSCHQQVSNSQTNNLDTINPILPDTTKIPNDEFGELVRYGRNLMLQTAYYIGPNGINGHYTLNKMSCTNCHQWAGTKPYSFNLMHAYG